MIEQRLWDHPEECGIGRYCVLCGREHFNEGELCTRCRDRMEACEE